MAQSEIETEIPVSSARRKQIRTIALSIGSLLLLSSVIFFGRKYLAEGWNSLRLVSTIVNLTPTLLAILFAFVVDKDLVDRVRWRWCFRICLVLCGVGLSVLLWHMQALQDAENDRQITNAVSEAVREANLHADGQFTNANEHSDQKFNEVKGDLTNLGNMVDIGLKAATGDIDKNLVKVGRPAPQPIAALTFTLWGASASADHPLLADTSQQDSDGAYPVSFSVANWSSTTARSVDIWIEICNVCTFARESSGFEHPDGADSRVRHRKIGDLNPGVSFEKMTVFVKAPPVPLSFIVSMHYSCENCGGKIAPDQFARITEIPEQPPRLPKLSTR